MKTDWRIGCSGFAYKEWRDVFYHAGMPQRRWFEYYTEHFNTLELNVTFYRFPTIKSLQGWYNQAPEGFTFSAKMPRSITHYKKFVDTERMVQDFYGLLGEGLKEKTGCVLTQLPPQIIYSKEKLELILQQMDPKFENVIEFRHASWWRKDVFATLKKQKITFCGVSFPKIEHDDAVINRQVVYYRFHGVPKLFFSEYSKAFLKKIGDQILQAKSVKKAYVYFNNTASTAALKNAKFLQKYISSFPPNHFV